MTSTVGGLPRIVVCFAFSVGAASGWNDFPARAVDGSCHVQDVLESEDEAQSHAQWFDYWDNGEINAQMAIDELKHYILQLQYEMLILNQAGCQYWSKRYEHITNLQLRLRQAYSVLRKLERPHH